MPPYLSGLTEAALLGYPNPFTSQTMVACTLPVAGPVTAAVFDSPALLVQRLYQDPAEAKATQ